MKSCLPISRSGFEPLFQIFGMILARQLAVFNRMSRTAYNAMRFSTAAM